MLSTLCLSVLYITYEMWKALVLIKKWLISSIVWRQQTRCIPPLQYHTIPTLKYKNSLSNCGQQQKPPKRVGYLLIFNISGTRKYVELEYEFHDIIDWVYTVHWSISNRLVYRRPRLRYRRGRRAGARAAPRRPRRAPPSCAATSCAGSGTTL